MKLFLGVPEMAKHLGVSRSRVKVLLAQGRLKGWINPDTRRYEIPYPPTITHGTRGPRLGSKTTQPAASKRATCSLESVRISDAATGNNFAVTPSEERK